LIHHQQDRLTLDEFKADVGGIGQAVHPVAVHPTVGHPPKEFLLEPVSQPPDPDIFRFYIAGGEFTGLAQTDDARRILGAPAPSLFLMATDKKRGKAGTPADIKHSDALGGMELVSRDRKHIDGGFTEANGDFAHSLDGVGMERNAASMRKLCRILHRKDYSGFVIGPHKAHNGRILGEAPPILLHIQPTFTVDRQLGDPIAFGLQMGTERSHGRMLDAAGHNVAFARLNREG